MKDSIKEMKFSPRYFNSQWQIASDAENFENLERKLFHIFDAIDLLAIVKNEWKCQV